MEPFPTAARARRAAARSSIVRVGVVARVGGPRRDPIRHLASRDSADRSHCVRRRRRLGKPRPNAQGECGHGHRRSSHGHGRAPRLGRHPDDGPRRPGHCRSKSSMRSSSRSPIRPDSPGRIGSWSVSLPTEEPREPPRWSSSRRGSSRPAGPPGSPGRSPGPPVRRPRPSRSPPGSRARKHRNSWNPSACRRTMRSMPCRRPRTKGRPRGRPRQRPSARAHPSARARPPARPRPHRLCLCCRRSQRHRLRGAPRTCRPRKCRSRCMSDGPRTGQRPRRRPARPGCMKAAVLKSHHK
jgi:hypothetical protein